ncbi:hypothetical protein Daud_0801 [Candidatus Desulforudis audaxviator MP104C]|uniref:Uncharacterized protein n=1 Tax=Desulforudis audaxviator (strain MP104C) TaxID=477974 RepID=B1I2V0_DESAP|nr:hypothetical protein [Candidatus Desulforudis audaxviator]ACA59319.1 hypothetical protein Daud_0801 [Candidatus Desulforudis audaxviator MP104C]
MQKAMAEGSETGVWSQDRVEALKNDLATLASYVTRDIACHKAHYEKGMGCFFEQENPGLLEKARKLGLSMDRLMEKLRALLQEEVAFWKQAKAAQRLQQLHEECEVTLALNELMGYRAKELPAALDYLRNDWLRSYGKLPLWLIADTAREKSREPLSFLCELCQARDFDSARDYERLSNWAAHSLLLRHHKEAVREAVREQTRALQRWIQERLQVDVPIDDVRELIARLPELHAVQHHEVEDQVRKHLGELERQRLVAQLQQHWQELTGTRTPGDWSRQVGIPAHFIVEREVQQIMEVVERAHDKTESQLRVALTKLQNCADVIGSLKDAEWVKKRFIERVVRDYAVLIETEADLAKLKGYLAERLGPSFAHSDLAQAQDLVGEWAKDYYRQFGYERVRSKLRELPAERVKAILEKLAQDPRVGILLLRES